MNKKFIIILLIIISFFLTYFLRNTCYFDYDFSLSCAWADEPITTPKKWQKLVEIGALGQISSKDMGRMLGVVQQAEAAGFPVGPFLNKALEGIAKRISPSVISQVLEKRLNHFHTCKKILQQMPGDEKEPASQRQQTLTALAESMARGVSMKELKELSKLAPKPRSVTLANASEDLATLKDLNFSPADAQEIVQSGLQCGLYKKRNRKMALAVRQARQKGLSNQKLKNLLISNMQRGKGWQGILRSKKNQGQNHIRQQPGVRGNNPGRGASSRSHR